MPRMVSVILFGFALALWGLVAASLAGYIPVKGTGIMNSAAAACVVLGGIGVMLDRARDKNKDALVTAVADLALRRALSVTGPQRSL